MTERLFYQDAYLKEFTAKVTGLKEKDGKTALTFDRTAFYPEGGGQLPDSGTIVIGDKEEALSIVDVQEEDGEIWHYLAPKEKTHPEIGQEISGTINWEKRFDHMQQHSGEHIVSGMICSAFHCDNVGFHMGEEDVTIDYNAKISMEEVLEIEKRANQYLWENHPFEELWPSPEELKTIEYRSKKELEGDVRITRFPGADTCACCGTHVKTSAEVGLVKFTAAQPFHDGTRLTLYCGKRAMDYLSMNFRANKDTAVLLSTKEERTAEIVEKRLEELTDLKGRLSRMQEDYFSLWAESFTGKETALVITDSLEPEEGRKLCDRIAETVSGTAAVFVKLKEKPGCYRYTLVNKNADIKDLVKEMNGQLSGKGGGRDGFAQGTVETEAKKIRAFFQE